MSGYILIFCRTITGKYKLTHDRFKNLSFPCTFCVVDCNISRSLQFMTIMHRRPCMFTPPFIYNFTQPTCMLYYTLKQRPIWLGTQIGAPYSNNLSFILHIKAKANMVRYTNWRPLLKQSVCYTTH